MAIPYSVTQLHAMIADQAPEALAESLTQNTFLYDRIQKVGPSDGKGPRWLVDKTANTSVGTFTVGGALNTPGAKIEQQASLGWGNYHGTFKFAERQLKQIEAAGNTMLITNLVQNQIAHIGKEIAKTMHTDTISGTSTDGIIGITSMVDDGNTYAGINRATAANIAFRSYVKDNAGGGNVALTEALMADVHNNLVNVIGGDYTVIFMGYAIFEKLTALSTGAVTTNANAAQTEARASLSKFVGFTDCYYRGRPAVVVPGYTGNRMDFFDESQLAYEVLKPFAALEPEATDADWLIKVTGYQQLRLHNPRKASASLQEIV